MIRFYWGPTKHARLCMPALDITWPVSLFGVSVVDVFVGILIRGKREVIHDKA